MVAKKSARKATKRGSPLGRKRGPAPKLEGRADAADILEELRQPDAKLCAIAARIKVAPNTLRAFRDKYEPKSVREASARASRLPRMDLQVSQLERLDAVSAKLELMVDAIDRAFRDPDDPTRYNLDPRAREVTVVVEEKVGERRVQKVRRLDELLLRVEAELGVSVVRWEVKSADPRVLLKDLAATMKPIAELLGKTRGEIRPDPAVSLNVFLGSKEWTEIEAGLVEALRPWPPALEAAGLALAKMGGER